MAGVITLLDQPRALDALGRATDAIIYFYYTGTTVLAPIYNDEGLTDPAANPIDLAAGEIFPDIFLDQSIAYRRRILYGDGSVHDVDPLPANEITAELSSGSGASLIGFQRPGGQIRTAESVFLDTWRVTDFMTEAEIADVTSSTGALDVTVAIQDAVDTLIAGGGGTLVFPKGLYKITDTITVDSSDPTVCVWLIGEGRNTIIRQSGAGKDAIRWSNTTFIYGGGLKNIQIRCISTAGHCVNVGYGMAKGTFKDVDLLQTNPTKNLIYGNFPNGNQGGIIGCLFEGGNWYGATAQAANLLKIVCNGQVFNENTFRGITFYNAIGLPAFDIGTAAGLTGYWLENNKFSELYFEICPAGAFRIDTHAGWVIENIRMWDTSSFTGNIIESSAGSAGTESRSLKVSNYRRLGGSLASGKYDVKVSDGHDFIYENIGMETSSSPKFDFGSKRCLILGRVVGTLDNSSGAMLVGTSTGAILFRGTVNQTYLNYYDEGTWTAALGGSGSNPTTPVNTTGTWTRIGRIVSVNLKFNNVDTTGASGNVVVTGLPFTVNASTDPVGVVQMVGMGSLASVAKAAGTTISLYRSTSNTNIVHADGTAGPGKSISISMQYIV